MALSVRRLFMNKEEKKLRDLRQKRDNDGRTFQEIRLLVKKLNHELDNGADKLLNILLNPQTNNNCMTVEKSGNLIDNTQWNVMVCKIWRWPDIKWKYELKPLNTCEFIRTKSRATKTCINPYHYKRITIPPVFIPLNQSVLNMKNELESSMRTKCTRNPWYKGSFRSLFNKRASSSTSCLKTISSSKTNLNSSINYNNYFCTSLNNLKLMADGCLSSGNDVVESNDNLNIDIYGGLFQPLASVPYTEPESTWAEIAYYELETRVGQLYKCQNDTIMIEGFDNTTGDPSKFSIDRLINEHRTFAIEKTRRNIEGGIHLHCVGGEIWADCHSSSPVFIQSAYLNRINGDDDDNVCKLLPGKSILIFSFEKFSVLLSQSVFQEFDSVFDMVNMCTIRVSFVKGWGGKYVRPDVTATPCWIEIRLNGAVDWLNEILRVVEDTKYSTIKFQQSSTD